MMTVIIISMRNAQMRRAFPNSLTLLRFAWVSSARACPVALLCPKRSIMILPVARLINAKLFPPLGLTIKRGAKAGGRGGGV